MSAPAWFTPKATERHDIVYPGTLDRAVELRKNGASQEDVDDFIGSHTIWVELKGLSAGDRALLDEMKFTDQGEGKISLGEQKIRAVELCLVAWSLEEPVTNVRELNALVLDEIFAAIPDGRLTSSDEKRANGSGPPPVAAQAPPIAAKDAASSE